MLRLLQFSGSNSWRFSVAQGNYSHLNNFSNWRYPRNNEKIDMSLNVPLTIRCQTTSAITQLAGVARKKTKFKKKNVKFAEILEVTKDATSETRTRVNKLRAKDLALLAQLPAVNLSQLYNLHLLRKSEYKQRKHCTTYTYDPLILNASAILHNDLTISNIFEKSAIESSNSQPSEFDLPVINSEINNTIGKILQSETSVLDINHRNKTSLVEIRRNVHVDILKETDFLEIVKKNVKSAFETSEPNEIVEGSLLDVNSSQIEESLLGEVDFTSAELALVHEREESFHEELLPNITKTFEQKNPVIKKRVTRKVVTGVKRTNLKKEAREKMAKIKWDVLEKAAKEASLVQSLLTYLEVCVMTNHCEKGFNTLKYYRSKGKYLARAITIRDVRLFNLIIQGYAAKGNLLHIKEILQFLEEDEIKLNIQSYIAILEGIQNSATSPLAPKLLLNTMDNLKENGMQLNDLFNKGIFIGSQREKVLSAIHCVEPLFVPEVDPPEKMYPFTLLHELNIVDNRTEFVSPVKNLLTPSSLEKLAHDQLQTELKGYVTVKSVSHKEHTEASKHLHTSLSNLRKEWHREIETAFKHNLKTLYSHCQNTKAKKSISIYPYFKVLSTKEYVDIVVQEIEKLALGSESYSSTTTHLCKNIGEEILSRYQIRYKQEHGIFKKVNSLYKDYCQWYGGAELSHCNMPREKWQQLTHTNQSGPTVDIEEKLWPGNVLFAIGRFMYKIIVHDVKIDANIFKSIHTPCQPHMVPAFYTIFRSHGTHLREEVKPHPVLVRLYEEATCHDLTFPTNQLPMLCPPLPWVSAKAGGYLLSVAKIIRLPYQAHQQKERVNATPPQNLYPALDSLNQLGMVPWKINQSILDLIIHVFNNDGNDLLGIPPPPSACPSPPEVSDTLSKQEKFKAYRQRLAIRRKKAEMYSLWCDSLYRFSLANHYRDCVLWFPHNMDFRGRVYPCPPYLNHLGSDVARSILIFAKGEPLGEKGLDWLKIHLVNLTGSKKKESLEGRLRYANEIMCDIFDSADNPLTGNKWWTTSDEPWQTLACCIEIAHAVRSDNPESYICHFPVHQDGSCNGLQHYAALGRDDTGAQNVNLVPADVPQDVYQSVAKMVEDQRLLDAADGLKIAQVLEGYVKRKVIKQTVMTTVYGVTKYGARLQIARQLKDIPEFPREYMWGASLYLVQKTFESLQEMFTATKEIQDWLTECAKLISQVCGQNVEWITPLGLPVVQPYSRPLKKVDSFGLSTIGKINEYLCMDTYERPNVMKQKNAFPPNFIHSLDSSHMMLTSLFCQRKGITFVSVHDCYWTHPCSVQIMNKVCREQFVALHNQPILEDLSKFLQQKYSYSESEFTNDGSVIDLTKRKLNNIFTQLPARGTFDINSVCQSTYFFS